MDSTSEGLPSYEVSGDEYLNALDAIGFQRVETIFNEAPRPSLPDLPPIGFHYIPGFTKENDSERPKYAEPSHFDLEEFSVPTVELSKFSGTEGSDLILTVSERWIRSARRGDPSRE
jgi:hypothetical protein